MDLAEIDLNSAYSTIYRITVAGRIVESEISVTEQHDEFDPLSVRDGCLVPADLGLAEQWYAEISQVAQNRTPRLFSTLPPRPRVIAAIVPTARHDIIEVRTQRSRVCSTQCINEFARFVGWTRRETEVADLLCAGMVPKQIAAGFSTEVSTVRSQIKSLLIKSGASSIGNLVLTLGRLPAIEPTQRHCAGADDRIDPVIDSSMASVATAMTPAANPFAPLMSKRS